MYAYTVYSLQMNAKRHSFDASFPGDGEIRRMGCGVSVFRAERDTVASPEVRGATCEQT